VAVVVTLCKGYDLDYVWRQVKSATPAAGRNAAGYYIQAAESGGEPPGRWWGPGAEALGFAEGQVVERKSYDLLFGERKAPDGTRLARPPSGGRTTADVYTRLLAAEPHATADRKRELIAEAAGLTRRSPLYFDLTISFSKSISIFHASLGENARLARLAGDQDGEEYWAGLIGEVDGMIWQAVYAGFGYFQREAGYTRTGSHAARVDGRETGQWREADLAVAHWLQHTSRDGDMQLHVHSQIAHTARTVADGKWRAPDSYGYNEHLGAVAAVVSQHLEEALTARFGLGWVAREDGYGFEIQGISAPVMRLFSARRQSIDAGVRARARAFQARYGTAPSQRQLAQLAQAANFATRARKDDAAPGSDALHAEWAARLNRTLGVQLASVAPSVWGQTTARHPASSQQNSRQPGPSERDIERAARQALAAAQRAASTWTKADLIKHLGRVLPRTGTNPGQAVRLLEEVAGRVLAGELGPVACLEAPEPVRLPGALIRADGRSVYQRHGGVRYATRAQLTTEEHLLAHAQTRGAPALTRAQAAHALGTTPARLDAALAGGAPGHGDGGTGRAGLRADQAAAVYWALTDNRRVSVINAPAGSGKTRVLAAAARAWTQTQTGPVIGITPSQAARNTLATAVPDSYNTAQFLGHLPGRRGARGPVPLKPGSLLLVDEASMISTADLHDLTVHAAASGAKVVVAGDTVQLQPVEDGGGMTLLAAALGYARLAVPVRFIAPWERAASLRLHAGDVSVLAVYNEHGRITGGDPDQIMDAAARAWVAHTLDGRDVLLMVADHARRRELCRRIRDDLIHLGYVAPGPAVRIADGQRASPGDLIVCTRNDMTVEAGEPGRTLANSDLLRIEAVTRRGLLVRRALAPDPATGQRRWTARCFLYTGYHDAEPGYAVTCNAAQSRTVRTGLALITGTEDRQHAYVALTRGTAANHAYVFTTTPKTADPRPGTRPARELARHDRLTALRAGHPAESPAAENRDEAMQALAQVIARDGQELSATQIRQRSFSSADHLAVLHAIWQDQIEPARHEHYQQLLDAALPAEYQAEPGHKAHWLWRTLRTAELAGLDPAALLADAITERSLTGARDITAVIDARIRRRTTGLVPQPVLSWTSQIPVISDPERQQLARDLAAAIDDRTDRIGEHAAEHALPWAVSALGPVPADPPARRDWTNRARAIGAYRELARYNDPADPIGNEPTGGDPIRSAAWHAAFTALGPAQDNEVRGLPDGQLLQLRDTYQTETAWAPPWAGDQLRQVRRAAETARVEAIRAAAEAKTAANHGDADLAARHEQLAASYQAIEDTYRERETALAGITDDRAAWDKATAAQRRLAITADLELRRRHPERHYPPLRSAEPEPLTASEPAPLTLSPSQLAPETDQRQADVTAGRQAFAARIAVRQHIAPDHNNLIGALPDWTADGPGKLLQAPRPQIPPSARVLELVRQREADREAAS
jgi:AAA domain/TrwC relaxase